MKEKIIIYHNPKCSKSRACVLEFNNFDFEYNIIDYTKNPFTYEELLNLISKLNISPFELLRKNEEEYKNLIKDKGLTDNQVVELMLKYPKLIERPIVVKGNNAVIARPLTKINELLSLE